ncbi:MAG TPA: phage holin family protein [Chryseolinea sp.]|nr:phage holin family protein [Chryseolinea sp.]
MLKDSILKLLKLDSLIENLTGYVESRIELTKMEIREDLAKGLSRFLLFILLGAVFTLFIILISIAVAHLIAKPLGAFWGFAIVAAFYLLLGLLVFAFRDAIIEKLQDQLVEIMKKKKE